MIHVYGSNLRAVGIDATSSPSATISIIEAFSGGEIHIHGTGIDAIAEGSRPVRVMRAGGGGSIHADVSAYNLRTGATGTITRIVNQNGTGHIHAPYTWQHVPDTDGDPNTNNAGLFKSVDGADMTPIMVGGYPHMSVYSTLCPASTPWYDQVDKICR